jgi:hypothetical protein
MKMALSLDFHHENQFIRSPGLNSVKRRAWPFVFADPACWYPMQIRIYTSISRLYNLTADLLGIAKSGHRQLDCPL